MNTHPHENLKIIRFEGEMLPHWAQLLDLVARLCPVPDETRRWSSRFTNCSGVDDARTVLTHGDALRRALRGTQEGDHLQSSANTGRQRRIADLRGLGICFGHHDAARFRQENVFLAGGGTRGRPGRGLWSGRNNVAAGMSKFVNYKKSSIFPWLLSLPAAMFYSLAALVMYGALGSPSGIPAFVSVLATCLFPSSLALWVLTDAQKSRRHLPYDFDSLVFWAWWAVVPIYLFATRGWRGFIPIGWFILLCLAANVLGGIPAWLLGTRP